MDVSGNAENAEKLLATAIKNLNARGAVQTILVVKGVRVYVFDVPPADGRPRGGGACGGGASCGSARGRPQPWFISSPKTSFAPATTST